VLVKARPQLGVFRHHSWLYEQRSTIPAAASTAGLVKRQQQNRSQRLFTEVLCSTILDPLNDQCPSGAHRAYSS
jgi:hypothetical protein